MSAFRPDTGSAKPIEVTFDDGDDALDPSPGSARFAPPIGYGAGYTYYQEGGRDRRGGRGGRQERGRRESTRAYDPEEAPVSASDEEGYAGGASAGAGAGGGGRGRRRGRERSRADPYDASPTEPRPSSRRAAGRTAVRELVFTADTQGHREHFEDRFQVADCGPWRAYAVYDGHGGSEVAEVLAHPQRGLCALTLSRLAADFPEKPPTKEEGGDGAVAKLIADAFSRFDSATVRKVRGADDVGSTAVALFLCGNKAYFANVGDSRAVLVAAGADVEDPLVFETEDHKPFPGTAEGERVEAAGGSCVCIDAVWRLCGNLALSRAFGDFRYKGKGLISAPEVTGVDLPQGPAFPALFVVIASDGVWDFVDSKDVADMVADAATDPAGFDGCRLAEAVVERALATAPPDVDTDNATALVVDLQNAVGMPMPRGGHGKRRFTT